MSIPAIIWLSLATLWVGLAVLQKFSRKPSDLFATFITLLVEVGLLYWGGFFHVDP